MKLEISTWSIVKIVLILAGFWVLWLIRDILALLFVVVILVAALQPSVEWLAERRVPRAAAVSLLILLILAGISLSLYLILPAVVEQLQRFVVADFPSLIHKIEPYYERFTNGKQLATDLLNQVQQFSGNIVTGVVSVFGGLFSAVSIIVMTFYLLLEEHPLRQAGLSLLPANYRNPVAISLERITRKLGAWLRGQFLLSLIVGVITAVAMAIIGVPAPLAIGLLAGILEILPIIGPLISGLIMVLMAATAPEAPLLKATLAVGFTMLLQFVEGHLLVPNVMRQAIGLSPVIVILALMIGAKLGGVTGAIISIPIVAILQVIAQDWSRFRKSPTSTENN